MKRVSSLAQARSAPVRDPKAPRPQNDHLYGFALLLAGLPVHVREAAHANASNSALASCKSAVSKPSVNQP